MTRIVAVEGPLKGTTFEVADGATVGRSRSCAVKIEGRHISRIHAKFAKKDSGLAIVDNDSRNGIFVNGQKVGEKVLAKDDEIEIGEHVLVYDPSFEVQPAAPPGAPSASEPLRLRPGGATTIMDTLVDPFAEAGGVPEKELRQAYDRQVAMLETARVLNLVEDDRQVLKLLLEKLVASARARRGFIMLADDKGKLEPASRIAPAGDDEFYLSNVIFHKVGKEKRSVLATDVARRGPNSGSPVAILAAPLLVRETFLGFVYLEAPTTGSPPAQVFSVADLKFAAGLSAFAAAALAHAKKMQRARDAVASAWRKLGEEATIVAGQGPMREILAKVEQVGPSDATVLVQGETGTGKELVARAIHARSPRATGPFVAVNCAAVSPALLESELFGHEKGAFTGAVEAKKGLFESAHNGTLFLDEAGETKPELQARLLRFLEERTFTRVGGTVPVAVDVRVIAATSHDLVSRVTEKKFREDLYWRLAVVILKLPALRDRKGDLPALLLHFLRTIGGRWGGALEDHVDADVIQLLQSHAWPGNVRELRNAVEQMLLHAGPGKIKPEHVPMDLVSRELVSRARRLLKGDLPLPQVMADLEKSCLEEALRRTGGNKSAAAELLGISRPTLYEKLKTYGLEAGDKS